MVALGLCAPRSTSSRQGEARKKMWLVIFFLLRVKFLIESQFIMKTGSQYSHVFPICPHSLPSRPTCPEQFRCSWPAAECWPALSCAPRYPRKPL